MKILVVSTPGTAVARSATFAAQFPAMRVSPAICRSTGFCLRSTCSSPTVDMGVSTRR
jgi:hypothetical protein